MTAAEADRAAGGVERDVHQQDHRPAAGGLAAEELELFRQDGVGRVVDGDHPHAAQVADGHQRRLVLIQRPEALFGPGSAQFLAAARQALVVPVVVAGNVQPGPAAVAQLCQDPFDGGFGREAEDVADQGDQVRALLLGLLQRRDETGLGRGGGAGFEMARLPVGARHAAAESSVGLAAGVVERQVRVGNQDEPEGLLYGRAAQLHAFTVQGEGAGLGRRRLGGVACARQRAAGESAGERLQQPAPARCTRGLHAFAAG